MPTCCGLMPAALLALSQGADRAPGTDACCSLLFRTDLDQFNSA